ncbi:MAG TPA: ABC transporter ATP-binding protein, partial [Candidatus Acetothermia bacterium]|nr:ABC transporter ATP-binding protein [Candidatus Acetothermia bacterium]
MRGILRQLWRYRLWLLAGVLALFIVDAAQLVSPLIVRAAVDDLVLGLEANLPRYALYLVGIAGAVLVFRFLWRLFLFGAGRRIERDLRARLYGHLLTLSPSFYALHPTGDLMAHATNDLEAVRRACGMGVLLGADTVIMTSFALLAMVSISPRLTLQAFVPLPLITLVVLGFGRLIHRRFERVQESFAHLTERVREAVSGIRILRAFAREEGMGRAFEGDNRKFVQLNMALVRVWGVFRPLIGLLAGL